MPLNAMRFAAKREVKWCKTQYNVPINARQKHKYPRQWYKYNLLEPLDTWLKMAKCTLKSGVLGAKSSNLGQAKARIGSKLERQNGAKCRWHAQNWTKKGTRQTQICSLLPVLRVIFALEGCASRGCFVKIF